MKRLFQFKAPRDSVAVARARGGGVVVVVQEEVFRAWVAELAADDAARRPATGVVTETGVCVLGEGFGPLAGRQASFSFEYREAEPGGSPWDTPDARSARQRFFRDVLGVGGSEGSDG